MFIVCLLIRIMPLQLMVLQWKIYETVFKVGLTTVFFILWLYIGLIFMFACTQKRIYCASELVRARELLRVVINKSVCESVRMCMYMYVRVFVCVCARKLRMRVSMSMCVRACTRLCMLIVLFCHYGTRLICHIQITCHMP